MARLIDQRIHDAYRLAPNNYIAHDMRYGKSEFVDLYTEEQKEAFREHLSGLRFYEDSCDLDTLSDILISIYSNPIDCMRR